MNKKRKILTTLALAMFGAIILTHYLAMGWDWIPSGGLREITTWHNLGLGYDLSDEQVYDEKGDKYLSNDPNAGLFDDLLPGGRPKSGYIGTRPMTHTSPKAPKGTILKDGRIKYPITTWIADGTGTSHFRVGWVSAKESMLPDVRMPLFVLTVFYAGLFAMLGDNKRKEQ
jgi:hypothetical protein